jgi:hypothetical protein
VSRFRDRSKAMKLFERICVGMLLLPVASLWSQVDNSSTQPVPAYGVGTGAENNNNDDRMLTPAPVGGQSYPTSGTSGERSNYLRGGLAFTGAYTDNALGSVGGRAVSDVSYSVAPFIALDESTPRLHLTTTYAPGFTFYQKTSARNEQDQNASINLQYRLSPHVTFSARDGFQKSSDVFNQPFFGSATPVSGGSQEPNLSVIAPVAPLLSNSGNLGITWQFAANGMVGASGTFTNLHYLDQAEVPGLADSSSQGGSVFYSLRISKMHYIGSTYQYQRLIASPTNGQSETQTHALLFFYTLYATSRFSMSFFGGPQYSDTVEPLIPPFQIQRPDARAWTPAAGASMSWQGRTTNAALSYSHVISGGGGLTGAVQMSSVSASIGQQLTRRLSGSVGGGYTQNDLVASALTGSSNGHTVSGTASLQQQVGQHLNVQLGYTRLHQAYSSVAVLAATPDTNREFVSISYQFSRPLGR